MNQKKQKIYSECERISREIDCGIEALQIEINDINTAAEKYSGGLSIDEVLHPEGIVVDLPDNNTPDGTAIADKVEITEEDFPNFPKFN